MPRAQRQDFLARSLFERKASVWHRHYAPDGAMLERVSRFADAVAGFRPECGRLLDFGCGTGEISRALAAQGWEVTGCDASPAMIEMARSAENSYSVKWVVLDADGKLPFPAASFDIVIASSVFEYLGDPTSVLKELARVLVPSGGLFATVPDMRHPYRKAEEARRRLLSITPLRLLLQLTRWRDVANYLRLSVNRYSGEEWGAFLEGARLRPESVAPSVETLLLLVARKER